MQTSNSLWNQYKTAIWETFPDLENICDWADWEENNTSLSAKIYSTKHILKSREVEIRDEKSCIYNNIIYPRTGSNLPCFGMDLMGFFDKKVIIVFDFQHPVENYLFSHPDLPKADGSFRFFEPGNHFSENVYVAKCIMSEVNGHLEVFKKYLTAYKNMLECEQPTPVVEAPVAEEEVAELLSYESDVSLHEMTKDELEEYGRTVGIELDKRHSRKRLVQELEEYLTNS